MGCYICLGFRELPSDAVGQRAGTPPDRASAQPRAKQHPPAQLLLPLRHAVHHGAVQKHGRYSKCRAQVYLALGITLFQLFQSGHRVHRLGTSKRIGLHQWQCKQISAKMVYKLTTLVSCTMGLYYGADQIVGQQSKMLPTLRHCLPSVRPVLNVLR